MVGETGLEPVTPGLEGLTGSITLNCPELLGDALPALHAACPVLGHALTSCPIPRRVNPFVETVFYRYTSSVFDSEPFM